MTGSWFRDLFGFDETSQEQVRTETSNSGTTLHSHANGRSWNHGTLVIPSLEELRQLGAAHADRGRRNTVEELVADVRDLHADPAHAGALFQVASQFNLLEMVSPSVTPDQGITGYATDRTQGPACAISAAAGTLFRNSWVEVEGRPGQSADRQIDTLADLGLALGNSDDRLWRMENGYALATEEGLRVIAARLESCSEDEREALGGKLRIGVHENTDVTLPGAGHRVSQAYCSALPVAYSDHPAFLWEPFARWVLEAAYEATLWAGVTNAFRSGSDLVFLTLLGGGAFGNARVWIHDAIERALTRVPRAGLSVRIVSYGRSDPMLASLLSRER